MKNFLLLTLLLTGIGAAQAATRVSGFTTNAPGATINASTSTLTNLTDVSITGNYLDGKGSAQFRSGLNAGQYASGATYSSFMGRESGQYASGAIGSSFSGYKAGNRATNSSYSLFGGYGSGNYAFAASDSIFMGRASGFNASGASQSIFQGYLSGHDATNSSYSIFQGANSGYSVIRPSTWIVDSRSTNVGTNGLIYGEFDNFRMSVNGTLSVRTNLIALQTASIPTNTASFDIDTTDFVMNKRYTNDNRRASVVTCLHMAPSATDAASVGLYIDQNHDGSYDTQILSEVAGGPSSPAEHHPITGWIQPGGIFVFTNLSSGTAAATIHSGSSQYVRQ